MRRVIGRFAVIVSLGIATLAYGSLEKNVTVHIEGKPVSVRTFAGTVGGALERAGVELSPKDLVQPSPSTAIDEGAVIDVRRAKRVTLVLNGRERTEVVTALTVGEALAEIEVEGTLIDRVKPRRSERVRNGMTIRYDRAVPVTVHHGKERTTVITNARRVRDVVAELGITLREKDFLRPRGGRTPRADMDIHVLRVKFRERVREVKVPYSTVLRRTKNLEYGVRKVIEPGRTGLTRVKERLRLVNGEKVGTQVLNTRTLRQPRTRIIAIGAGYPGCVCNDGTALGKGTWYHRNDGMTAAHRTLPFGTVVRVVNLDNGKWVNVRIVDRGPWGDGRIIDLSDDAFARLAPLSKGVLNVRIRW